MWLASEMAAFAHVAELGSFTAAARSLGVPKVAVSRAIASLEKRLGTRLLTRTTRRVAAHACRRLLQPHCQRLLHEVESVRLRFAPRRPRRSPCGCWSMPVTDGCWSRRWCRAFSSTSVASNCRSR